MREICHDLIYIQYIIIIIQIFSYISISLWFELPYIYLMRFQTSFLNPISQSLCIHP